MKKISNVKNLTNTTAKVKAKNTLPFFWTIADFITTKGPDGILVYYHNSKYEKYYELIFRLLLRIPGKNLESWSIFRRESREWVFPDKHDRVGGCILRKSSWDCQYDKREKKWETSVMPSITDKVCYLNESFCKPIATVCLKLDAMVIKGIKLNHSRSKSDSEISIFRSFNWGCIDLTWGTPPRTNKKVENAALKIREAIEEGIEEALKKGAPKNVRKLEFCYVTPIEEARELILPDE